MSVEAVTARIDQILQMQQKLFDPQSAASSGAGAAGAGATSATTAALPASDYTAVGPSTTASPSFSDVLASAQAGGTSPVAATADIPSPDAASKVQAMVTQADSLVGKPYVWGGGHGSFAPTSGYDCSGFVSSVLHAGGYLSAPADTTSLPSQAGIESGPGQYVTVYDRAQPGENGHVIIELNGQFYRVRRLARPVGRGRRRAEDQPAECLLPGLVPQRAPPGRALALDQRLTSL